MDLHPPAVTGHPPKPSLYTPPCSHPFTQAAAHELQVKAAAALANLSADRLGLEAMVTEQEQVGQEPWALSTEQN